MGLSSVEKVIVPEKIITNVYGEAGWLKQVCDAVMATVALSPCLIKIIA